MGRYPQIQMGISPPTKKKRAAKKNKGRKPGFFFIVASASGEAEATRKRGRATSDE